MKVTNMNVLYLASGLKSTNEDRYIYNEKMMSVLEVLFTSLRKGERLCEGSTV